VNQQFSISARRKESHDPFGGVQHGRVRVSPHRFTITVIPAKAEIHCGSRSTHATRSDLPDHLFPIREVL
jgi:hypothetical protein